MVNVATHFTQCQHLKPPFQLTPCPQNTFHTVPTPQTPFSTAPMPSKHISHSANTSNPLFNCPHALKTHFTQCQHLKPPFQLPPCPENTFHPPVPTPQTPFSFTPCPENTFYPPVPTPQTPFSFTPCPQNTFHTVPTPQTPFLTAPMPSKHISPSANTSNPLFNCPHALKTYFTQCQHLKPPFQLPPCPENTFHPPVPTPQTPFSFTPCPQNTFHPVPTPQTPFSTHPMPSKHISHSANTSNPLFNCPHALKTYFTQCQHRAFRLQSADYPYAVCAFGLSSPRDKILIPSTSHISACLSLFFLAAHRFYCFSTA